jgi:hypothetical protein
MPVSVCFRLPRVVRSMSEYAVLRGDLPLGSRHVLLRGRNPLEKAAAAPILTVCATG